MTQHSETDVRRNSTSDNGPKQTLIKIEMENLSMVRVINIRS